MADAGVMAKDADILLRLPTGSSATVKAAGYFDKIVLDVEATINVLTRYNWSDAFGALNVDVKGILTDTVSCLCAIEGIIFDMSGINTRTEAEDDINVLRDIALRNMSILRDKKNQDFIIGA